MERSITKRKTETTPAVKDITQQTKDPQSAGSRGLDMLIKDKRHIMPKSLIAKPDEK